MSDTAQLKYVINDPIELNLSYMPFINDGGLFIPTAQTFSLGDRVLVDLQLPGKKDALKIEGKVVWLTPSNALHHVVPGIGIQFVGNQTQEVRTQIEGQLDRSVEIGGYTYGISESADKK